MPRPLQIRVPGQPGLQKAFDAICQRLATLEGKQFHFGGDLRGLSDENSLVLEGWEGDEGSEVVKVVHPFQPYRSPYTGPGEAPGNQSLKFKIRPGYLSDFSGNSRFPSNLNTEFTATDDTDEYFVWLKAAITSDNPETGSLAVVSVEYGKGEEIPETEMSSDSDDAYPVTVYLPIFKITTADGKITLFEEYVTTCLSLSLTVTSVFCGGQARSIFWANI